MTTKANYLNAERAEPRINQPETSLFPGTFQISKRIFIDPLHLG